MDKPLNCQTSHVIWSLEASDMVVRSSELSCSLPGCLGGGDDTVGKENTFQFPRPSCASIQLSIAPAGIVSTTITASAIQAISFVFRDAIAPGPEAAGKNQLGLDGRQYQ